MCSQLVILRIPRKGSLYSQLAILRLLAREKFDFRKKLSGKPNSLLGAAPRLQRASFSIINTVTPSTLLFSILTKYYLMGCLCSRFAPLIPLLLRNLEKHWLHFYVMIIAMVNLTG